MPVSERPSYHQVAYGHLTHCSPVFSIPEAEKSQSLLGIVGGMIERFRL